MTALITTQAAPKAEIVRGVHLAWDVAWWRRIAAEDRELLTFSVHWWPEHWRPSVWITVGPLTFNFGWFEIALPPDGSELDYLLGLDDDEIEEVA